MSSAEDRTAFSSKRDGNREIYVINTDGTQGDSTLSGRLAHSYEWVRAA